MAAMSYEVKLPGIEDLKAATAVAVLPVLGSVPQVQGAQHL
jgi:hypothetical protein